MRSLARMLLLSGLAAALAGNLAAQRGYMSAPRIGPAGRSPYPLPRNFPAPLGLRPPAAGYTGIRPGAFNSHASSKVLPFGFWGAPFYFPPLFTNSDPFFAGVPYDPASDPNLQAAMNAQNALVDQVQKLTAQVAQLQAGQQAPAAPPPQQESSPPPPQPPVTLVLRNGQQLQVQNYAVMGQTFWDFTNQAARKIPLANIDIAASTKATEERGGQFPQLVPTP